MASVTNISDIRKTELEEASFGKLVLVHFVGIAAPLTLFQARSNVLCLRAIGGSRLFESSICRRNGTDWSRTHPGTACTELSAASNSFRSGRTCGAGRTDSVGRHLV